MNPDARTPRDPLRRDAVLEHTLTLPVLGIPVTFAATAAEVIEIAEEAYGNWRALLDRPDLCSDERVSIRIFVEDVATVTAEPGPIVYRLADPDRVVLRMAGGVGITDVARRDGVAWVDPARLHDRATFRYGVLEAMTQSVLTFLDRQPFHAAAVERDGRAVLLAGPSGSGKSTVAYAAAQRGYRVLAEDLVFLQMGPPFRVWGLPGHLHLPFSAREHFVELDGALPELMANGKRKIAIDLRDSDAMPAVPVVDRAAICVLGRSTSRPVLTPMDGDALTATLTARLEPGFDLFADTVGGAIRQLARFGGWRLDLSDDPQEAVTLLERVLPS